jgi:hypothetical protein
MLTEKEVTINARPLRYVGESENITILTPTYFLSPQSDRIHNYVRKRRPGLRACGQQQRAASCVLDEGEPASPVVLEDVEQQISVEPA